MCIGRKPAELITKTMTQVMKDILERNPELLKTSGTVLNLLYKM